MRTFIKVFERYVKEDPGNGATLSIGVPVGGPGGGSFTWTFERQIKEGSGNGSISY